MPFFGSLKIAKPRASSGESFAAPRSASSNFDENGAKRGDDAFPETMLEIEGEGGSIIVTKGEKMIVTTQGLTFEDNIGGPLLSWTSRPWHVSQEAVLHTNRHMAEAWRAGRPADTSAEDNLKTYALVEAAYEAARTHNAAKPPQYKPR